MNVRDIVAVLLVFFVMGCSVAPSSTTESAAQAANQCRLGFVSIQLFGQDARGSLPVPPSGNIVVSADFSTSGTYPEAVVYAKPSRGDEVRKTITLSSTAVREGFVLNVQPGDTIELGAYQHTINGQPKCPAENGRKFVRTAAAP